MNALYPNEALRTRCLTFFTEAIQQAHGLGESRWSVTLRKRQVSLNVGKLLAVGLSKGSVYLGLPPTRLSEELAGLLDTHGVWDKEFSTFPSTQLIELSAESFVELVDQLRAPFADFLRIAADTARQPPTYRLHSPGALACLQVALGKTLPAPVFATRGGEEESEQDTPRPRAVAIKTPPILFERVEYHLDNLLSYVELGDIGLPDIQRPFVWKWTKVRDLLDSMYRGYPVGYLLFWTNENVQGTRQIGTGAKQSKVPQLLVVDGQQRLTSLFAVFRGHAVLDEEFRQVRVEIAFRPRDGKFEVSDAAIRKDPEFIPNISELWSSGKPTSKLIREFLKNLDDKKGLDEEEEDAISHNIERLVALNKYPFTALKILPGVEEEAVSNIFVRINSEGVKLNQADFILTLLSVFWEEGRTALESFCRQARTPVAVGGPPSPFNHFIEPSPDQLLRVSVALAFDRARLKAVYQILRGKNPESGQFSAERRQQQFDKLREAQNRVLDLNNWHLFLGVLVAAGYRSSEMISSQTSILYAYVVYLIGKLRCGVEEHKLQRLVSRWFFTISVSGRYTGSPESVMEEDLNRLKEVATADAFAEVLERIIASTLTHDFWTITLPNDLETSAAKSPSLFAYYAAQNRLGAPVLFSDKKISDLLDPTIRSRRKALERHHLFPRAWLERNGVGDMKVINQAANFAFLEWPDNLQIGDAPPTDYVPELKKRFSSAAWEKMGVMHALPAGWEKLPYEKFLAERRALMATIIRRSYEDLSGISYIEMNPAEGTDEERNAWELIEKVEHSMRDVVRRKYTEKWGNPVENRVRAVFGDGGWEKIEKNRKRGQYRLSPAASGDREDVLDFITLGQLEQMMVAPDAWALFSGAFSGKPEFDGLLKAIKPVRNDQAHFRRVPEQELLRCRLACGDLLTLLGRL
ncbi:DUF262 domain-containing protein [Archangium sp.]|uniref:GmrSD restriction endonuclease domain-containing protein n=1 Tax=Archangium sp. TaxID=1872627 RepID=UPI00389AC061